MAISPLAGKPAPRELLVDLTIERIGDLLAYDLPTILAAARTIDPTTAKA